jgi:putative DNA primase/helicase
MNNQVDPVFGLPLEFPTDSNEDRPPGYSDDALAIRFADQHAHDLRFVAGWGRWLRWDGTVWLFDETLFALNSARHVCREAAATVMKTGNGPLAFSLASRKTIEAVERLARSDPRLAVTTDQWDVDPWLLNTPDGAIDLRTGQCRPHCPLEYMTKTTAVAPRGDCPRFLAFLHEIMDGDRELVAYLGRVLGYALTGETREHALFFAHGTGANGKSVLMSTVGGILGGYHQVAPMDAFVVSYGDRHPTDIAGLRGARLVSATETEQGRFWAEARIKLLTGGDAVSARFMRRDFFQFRPQFKLLIAGNHKPSLRSVGEAMRRRFHLVPFAV